VGKGRCLRLVAHHYCWIAILNGGHVSLSSGAHSRAPLGPSNGRTSSPDSTNLSDVAAGRVCRHGRRGSMVSSVRRRACASIGSHDHASGESSRRDVQDHGPDQICRSGWRCPGPANQAPSPVHRLEQRRESRIRMILPGRCDADGCRSRNGPQIDKMSPKQVRAETTSNQSGCSTNSGEISI